MGLQGLGSKAIHAIQNATGLHVVRATVNNGHDWRIWAFTTADHQHGWYDRTTGGWLLDEPQDQRHTSPMCGWLFGPGVRPRDDTWGQACACGGWHVVDAAAR